MKKDEIRTKWIRHTPLMKLDECVDKAMQEYADQQTKELQQRVEELYLKNKELKTHLTQQIECTEHIKDICDNYESENQQLQQRFEGLQNSLEINEKLSVEATNDFVKALNEIDEEKKQLQAKIDELEIINNDLKQAMIRGSELNDKLKFDEPTNK